MRNTIKSSPGLAEITPVLSPYRGGMGTVALENARMATDAGVQTTIFTPYYRSIRSIVFAQEKKNGCLIVRLRPFFSYGNAAFLPQLFWKLKRYSVIHLHYPAAGLELPVLFWGLCGKKILVTYHMDLVGKAGWKKWVFQLYNFLVLPCILRVADRIFVSSLDYAKNSPLFSRFVKKYDEKISELPNSVDTERFFAKFDTVNNKSEKIILFVGGLDSAHYFKGVNVLLDASALLLKNSQLPVWKICIVGDGDLRASYEEYARVLGIADRVYFTGSVSHEELPEWYRKATCSVLPSIDSTEAFGVALIEANSCGTPVIATNLPGVRSVVEEGVSGFLVAINNAKELAEKISILLSDEEKAKRMGDAGRKRVEERYSYKKVSHIYLTNFEKLCSKAPN